MASYIYDSWLDDVYHHNIDPSADTFYVLLTTSSYTPNRGTDQKRSDVTNEVTGTGYTSGGAATAITISKDTTNHRNELTFADVSWVSSTITAHYGVIYKHRGGAASADNLVAENDFGSDISTTGGTFTVHYTSTLRAQL